MSSKRPPSFPTLPIRHKRFSLINELIQDIQKLYDQTPTEAALHMLKKARQLKAIWWNEEDVYRDEELDELFKNFNDYSHSARTSALDEDLQ